MIPVHTGGYRMQALVTCLYTLRVQLDAAPDENVYYAQLSLREKGGFTGLKVLVSGRAMVCSECEDMLFFCFVYTISTRSPMERIVFTSPG